MKRNLHIAFLVAIAFLFGNTTYAQTDSIVMGSGYAEDVFYSLENGEVSMAPRTNWDIAFYTSRMSAGIITNDGNGVELFVYPNGDTSDWSGSIDTNGMSGWQVLYNTTEHWEEGAFNVNAKGHPDYGWGIYNTVDHSLYGDSIYIINTGSGIKKLWIEKKVSVENIYHFTYAELDGSNEQNVELDVKPYETKLLVYYTMETNKVLDREPAKENWDLLFTKYMDWTTNNDGDSVRYPRTGVASNFNVASKNFFPVGPSFSDWFPGPFDDSKTSIGSDWKYFDGGVFQYFVTDSNYYFVRTIAGDIYKLSFHSWAYQTGTGVFEKELISLSSINESDVKEESFLIYPNPVTDFITIQSPENLSGNLTVRILDQSGRQVFNNSYTDNELNQGIKLNNLNMSSGIYIVSIIGNNYAKSQKLVVR